MVGIRNVYPEFSLNAGYVGAEFRAIAFAMLLFPVSERFDHGHSDFLSVGKQSVETKHILLKGMTSR